MLPKHKKVFKPPFKDILFQINPSQLLMNQYIWTNFCATEHIIYFSIPVDAELEVRETSKP